MLKALAWDRESPHILDVTVEAEHIDEYQHVNNAEYLRWLERCAWRHTNALGLTLDLYKELDCAMVISRHELDYQAPAYEGDELQMATWVTDCDRRLTITRHFQLRRVADNKTLMRAKTTFVSTYMSSGKPRRMPPQLAEGYASAV